LHIEAAKSFHKPAGRPGAKRLLFFFEFDSGQDYANVVATDAEAAITKLKYRENNQKMPLCDLKTEKNIPGKSYPVERVAIHSVVLVCGVEVC
jgi:hypothetical protein